MQAAYQVFRTYQGAESRTAIPNLSGRRLKAFLIPLPPLPEQRRIVARIEELMERVREAKRLREEAKKDADRLMQAALAEVFPRPGTEPPPGWRWVRLGEVCKFSHGGTPRKSAPEFWNGDIPWVSPKDMCVHIIDDTRDHITKLALEKSSTRLVKKDSVLIVVRSGILARLLPVAVTAREVAFNQDLKAIELDSEVLTPWFLFWSLRSLEPLILSEGVKKGVTVHSIRSGFLENLKIAMPSKEKQRRIVAYLDKIQSQVTALKQAREATETELQRLEQAILDKAFRGEL
jgi:type I restriction enzyme S subunit